MRPPWRGSWEHDVCPLGMLLPARCDGVRRVRRACSASRCSLPLVCVFLCCILPACVKRGEREQQPRASLLLRSYYPLAIASRRRVHDALGGLHGGRGRGRGGAHRRNRWVAAGGGAREVSGAATDRTHTAVARYGTRGMQTAGPGKEPRACTAYPGMGPLTVLLRGNTGSGAGMLLPSCNRRTNAMPSLGWHLRVALPYQ